MRASNLMELANNVRSTNAGEVETVELPGDVAQILAQGLRSF